MTGTKNKIWLAATVLFAACLVVFMLSYIVTSPWHVITDIGGDGAKNNFTYLYESMYGSGYWFTGMNYPYGEHIVYTDAMPLLSVFFAQLHNVSAETALTVLWWSFGLSYVLCMVYLYLILRHFGVAPILAMVFAGLITVFSPQLFCLNGHYALGFTCVIPMMFWWTIRYYGQPQVRYPVWFFLLGIVMAFIHPYYAGMMLVWTVFYAIGYFVFTRASVAAKAKHITPLLASVLLVLAIIGVVMKLTDPVKDRPSAPYFTLETCTSKKQIVSSAYSPLWQYITKATHFSKVADGGEGYTYLGMAVIIALLVALVTGVARKIKRRDEKYAEGFPPIWLFMSAGTLLLSMGVPIIWLWDKPWASKLLSPLLQFRALGRFSWIFYYTITVYAVVAIYSWYKHFSERHNPVYGGIVLFVAIALWSYEASGYIEFSRGRAAYGLYYYDMMFSKHEEDWASFLAEHHYRASDFQSLLLLPYFHVGTEKLWLDADWLLTMGTKAGLQLHLPVMDVMLSRSSLSQAKKQVKLAAGPYAGKPVLDDIKTNKPFLLLKLDLDSLNPDQKYLSEASDYVGHYSQCDVYACYPDRLRALDREHVAAVDSVLPYMRQPDTCLVDKGDWYVQHFDSGGAKECLFSGGGVPYIPAKERTIATFPVNVKTDSQLYEFSCWFLLNDRNARSPFVTLQMANSPRAVDTVFTRQSTDNSGMWYRDSKYFYIHKDTRAIKCTLVNYPEPSYNAMDEIMLRPADAVIISKGIDGKVMVNNHLLKQ